MGAIRRGQHPATRCACSKVPGGITQVRDGVCQRCFGAVDMPPVRIGKCACKQHAKSFSPYWSWKGVCQTCLGAVMEPSEEPPASAFNEQVGGGHYKDRAIQPFHFVRRNNIPHAEGECIYKLLRWREKGGIADLEKVIHTIQLIIEEERNHGNGLIQTGKQ